MKENIILTGDRPTGKLHIGHFVGSLRERVKLQNEGNYKEMLIMIADMQALTDNSGNPQKVRDNIIEVMLDYLSVGLDPEKTIFFVQSEIKALTELTMYYMNLVTLPRLLRNPTVKSEIKMRGYDNDTTGVPVGFANYPISQAADITAFKANVVPVGDDQLPMIEQTREIVKSFNNTYNEVLIMPNAKIPDNKVCCRLPGTDGNAKMSKSLGNGIYLSDTKEEVKRKVMSMYTDPNHLKISDPGNVEENTVFTYLDAFCTDEDFIKYLPEYKNLDELKNHYRRGGLGDVKIKQFLNQVLEGVLEPIREKRKYYEQRIPEVIEILKLGTAKANSLANETLNEVKHAIGIDYFNEEFLNEQLNKFSK
ncbi:MAG: tryptophan--tRNA ligase [Bacilli bacterium]|nr:tryptophan--tRNA ligase [Bacilli bacterium]